MQDRYNELDMRVSELELNLWPQFERFKHLLNPDTALAKKEIIKFDINDEFEIIIKHSMKTENLIISIKRETTKTIEPIEVTIIDNANIRLSGFTAKDSYIATIIG